MFIGSLKHFCTIGNVSVIICYVVTWFTTTWFGTACCLTTYSTEFDEFFEILHHGDVYDFIIYLFLNHVLFS